MFRRLSHLPSGIVGKTIPLVNKTASMKKYLFLPAFLLFNITYAQEIIFERTTWAEIKAKAKQEKKLIFLDAYTTWCGPCKMLEKTVFKDAAVAEFYNRNFVNARKDMEKSEGLEIAKQYSINCYPSLLFIDGDGNVQHRSAGYLPE